MKATGIFGAGLIAALSLAAPAAPAARAGAPADSVFNDLRVKYSDKKLAVVLGNRVLAAARPKSSAGAKVLDYSIVPDPARRTIVYNVKLQYKGADTGKVYVADVVVVCDTRDPRAWEVVTVEFRDADNPKRPFGSDISALIRKLNQRR
jgi:hypothetical protein